MKAFHTIAVHHKDILEAFRQAGIDVNEDG